MTSVQLAHDEPLALIGDVHGEADRLTAVIESGVLDGRRAIFLGDYIDRGPDASTVLSSLVDLVANRPFNQTVLLRGNHEVALLDWLSGGQPTEFLANRGATTIRAYIDSPKATVLEDFARSFPAAHHKLLSETVLFAEGDGILVSHAGYNLDDPDSRTEREMTHPHSWSRLVDAGPRPRSLVVVGHYTQSNGVPFVSHDLIGLDTGCGTLRDHPLTVLLLPERTFRAF